jgi:hypothetical protein
LKIGVFEFNLRELSGSMGDFGTLLPLVVGYITICGMNPSGLLVMIGLANIVTGVVYRLPMPIEPMKVLAIVAIAGAWAPEKVYTSALVMGVIWLTLGLSGAMTYIARMTPKSVIRGIQLSLGVLLAVFGIKMISSFWILGLVSIIIVILLRENRYAPAAVVLVVLGIVIMGFKGELSDIGGLSFSIPPLTMIDYRLIWPVLVEGGFAQIPLTATNAVIATSSLISAYWPERSVSEKKLSLNMGVMNVVLPFFGGMPLCHGAGGLAGQYYFGARTGGANIIEGVIEIGLGLFLATGIAVVFSRFPSAIVGAMMLLVGIELGKFAKDIRLNLELIPTAVTVAGSVIFNMAVGFAAGLIIHYALIRTIQKRSAPPASD